MPRVQILPASAADDGKNGAEKGGRPRSFRRRGTKGLPSAAGVGWQGETRGRRNGCGAQDTWATRPGTRAPGPLLKGGASCLAPKACRGAPPTTGRAEPKRVGGAQVLGRPCREGPAIIAQASRAKRKPRPRKRSRGPGHLGPTAGDARVRPPPEGRSVMPRVQSLPGSPADALTE